MLLEEIGIGTFSKVYCKPTLNGYLAVKKIELTSSTNLTRLINEARLLSSCNHPHIVAFIKSYFEDSSFCIEMQYLQGRSLYEISISSNFDLIYQWIYQISLGLNYLHQRGIIHRDIKSSNIMVAQNNQVKIIDFGVSTFKSNLNRKNQQIVGSPCYMAPEVFLKLKYDEMIDIYSLGVCIYQLVYQKMPYNGTKKAQYWKNTLSTTILFDESFNCPHQLVQLMKSMLQINPNNRISLLDILTHPEMKKRNLNFGFSKA